MPDLFDEKGLRLLRKAASVAIIAVVVYAAVQYGLPLVAPFAAALLLALAEEPLVRRLSSKMPRKIAAILCTFVMMAVLIVTLRAVIIAITEKLGELSEMLPELASSVGVLRESRLWTRIYTALPVRTREALDAAFSNWEGLSSAAAAAGKERISAIIGLLGGLPGALLGVFTSFIAWFYISVGFPVLKERFRAKLPEERYNAFINGAGRVKTAAKRWAVAELKLSGAVFVVTACGLLIGRVENAISNAAAIALLDLLPIFGAGTVLVPWAGVSLLRGMKQQTFVLTATWLMGVAVREFLEPRVLGKQTGLTPLQALGCVYFGYRLFGVSGLILAPIAAAIAKGAIEGRVKKPEPNGQIADEK